MLLRQVPLAEAGSIDGGVAVVIDVLRAFTVAALALEWGSDHLRCVGTVEEALAQRDAGAPGARLAIGEVDGGKVVDAFDASNSPSQLQGMDLAGKVLVHRTSHGTQGLLGAAPGADVMLAASFSCAAATAAVLRSLGSQRITFVLTGTGFGDGEDDRACADYLEALLGDDGRVDPAPYLQRVRDSATGQRFSGAEADLPPADLEHALRLDAVDFALRATPAADHVRVARWS